MLKFQSRVGAVVPDIGEVIGEASGILVDIELIALRLLVADPREELIYVGSFLWMLLPWTGTGLLMWPPVLAKPMALLFLIFSPVTCTSGSSISWSDLTAGYCPPEVPMRLLFKWPFSGENYWDLIRLALVPASNSVHPSIVSYLVFFEVLGLVFWNSLFRGEKGIEIDKTSFLDWSFFEILEAKFVMFLAGGEMAWFWRYWLTELRPCIDLLPLDLL